MTKPTIVATAIAHALPTSLTERYAPVALQPASEDIWDRKYRLKNADGEPIEKNIDETYQRVAKALSDIETTPELRALWYEKFLWALRAGAIPAGRITSNAGAQEHKPETSLINCTVSGHIRDSMDDIMRKAHESALTLKAGCGIGYAFSTLRPKGAFVAGAGANTSGPLSFMDIFDKTCFTVASAGGRRGAQMGTFDVAHPDVKDFIRAKREDGRLRQFNLSLLITEDFMEAVKQNADWPLVFPINPKEAHKFDVENPEQVMWRDWPIKENYIVREDGKVACRIYDVIPAQRLWDLIMTSTYDFAEPGFILIDKVNEMNNNWWCENIQATNPCVTGDTWVHTSEGPKQVNDLVGVPFLARVDGQDHASGPQGFFKTAHKKVVKVETKEGYSLRLTADHRLKKLVKNSPWERKTEWCAAGDLSPGDLLVLNNHRSNPHWEGRGNTEEGYLMGLLVGDGTLKKDAAILSVWTPSIAVNGDSPGGAYAVMAEALKAAKTLKHRSDFKGWSEIQGRNEHRLKSAAVRDLAFSFGIQPSEKAIHPLVEKTSSDFYRGFLRGFFDADGSVQGKLCKNGLSLRLAQSDICRLEAVQRMLLRLGIVSKLYKNRREATQKLMPDGKGGQKLYDIKAQHELVLTGDNIVAFNELIGFADTDKQTKLTSAIAGYQKKSKVERFATEVVSITEDGEEDVYDVQVPGINTFDANAIHSHNCGEQPLPEYGSCWTGDMRLMTNHGLIKTEEAFELTRQGKPLLIAVDDVFSKNGTDLRPCDIVVRGKKEVLEIKFANGQKIRLTSDHRVYSDRGWVEAGQLSVDDRVHAQSRALSGLRLAPASYLGFLKYFLEQHAGASECEITRVSHQRALLPILNALNMNYGTRADGSLTISWAHPLAKEVLRASWESLGAEGALGRVVAAQSSAARYRQHRAIYLNSLENAQDLANAFATVTGQNPSVVKHGSGSWRIVDRSELQAMPALPTYATDLEASMLGWMLTDGWLTNSTGLMFSTQDDVALEQIGNTFKAFTGTNGGMRTSYVGQSTNVSSIACWKSSAVKKLKDVMGLESYKSKDIVVPENIFKASIDSQASFLSACFCADGSVDQDGSHVRLTSASRKFVEDVQLLLLNFGIHTAIREGISKGNVFHVLAVNCRDIYAFYRHIGFRFNTTKQAKLEQGLRDKHGWREMEEHQTERVVSIQSKGEEVVYDIEEFSTNTLIVNGLVVHNCLLGSINLTKFVRNPFTEEAYFDWQEYEEVVGVFTRMLDNVVEINNLPLERQRHEITTKRRHGMGYLGLGSALTMLRIPYGSPASVEMTEALTRSMAVVGWKKALELALEKGPAPILAQTFTVTAEMLRKRPEMEKDGWKVGQEIPGAVLHAKYSRYMQRIAQIEPELVEQLAEIGARFTHHSSIAPTGTISLSLGNNASNGIEPSFAHHYSRNIIKEGKKTKEKVEVYSYELLAYRELVNPNAMPYATDPENALPDYFISADEVSPKQHVDIQAAAQIWIDSSISKTANVPTDFPYEDFKDIYMYAYEKGLKGCTTFRFNPAAFQGVLVKEKDLENTLYTFVLEDGSTVELKGNDEVEYDGETHTAANLFDALKEGYYGKF